MTRLRELLDDCVHAAREQGFDGADSDYEFTPADVDYVTDALGYLPTSQQWVDAGLRWVGDAHIGDGR